MQPPPPRSTLHYYRLDRLHRILPRWSFGKTVLWPPSAKQNLRRAWSFWNLDTRGLAEAGRRSPALQSATPSTAYTHAMSGRGAHGLDSKDGRVWQMSVKARQRALFTRRPRHPGARDLESWTKDLHLETHSTRCEHFPSTNEYCADHERSRKPPPMAAQADGLDEAIVTATTAIAGPIHTG